MALSPEVEAILQAGMAGEKIGQAAHAAYWLNSYGHEGAAYQLKMLRAEFAKLSEAMAKLGGEPTGYLHLGKAGAAIAMAEDARKSALPDDTMVRVKPCLGDAYVITLGEACDRWKDARHFGIDGALRSRGEWRSQGLTIQLEEAA